MRRVRFIALTLLGLTALTFALVGGYPRPTSAAQLKPIRVGVLKSLFHDVPKKSLDYNMRQFGKLLHDQAGVNGRSEMVNDCFALAKQLTTGEAQLGVFHGHEFAWAQQRHPKLRPLMLAVNQKRQLYANLVVHKDSDIRGFAQLKGKTVSLPNRSRGHCRLFLKHHCEACGGAPEKYLGKIVKHSNLEEALDQISLGKVPAIVIDSLSLELYRQIKSGYHRRLRIVKQSPAFPAIVVAFSEGKLSNDLRARLRNGMLTAHQRPRSRQMLTLSKLTAFEDVPRDFWQTVVNIRKAYAAPTESGR